jgi:lipopolysaccharide export system protein LptA
MFRKILGLGLFFGLIVCTTIVRAGDTVNVEADQMEIIDAQHQTVFQGNVVVVRPTDQIRSDNMIVTSVDIKQTDGTVKSVTDRLDAHGNVVITTATQTIVGNDAIIYVRTDKLVVTGKVSVVEGTSRISGEKLNLDIKTKNLQMTGGRVSGSFVPK